MKKVKVKDEVIGEGMPCICVPIVSATHQDIIDDFNRIKDEDFDLIELRIDFFNDILNEASIINLLNNIKLLNIIKPIIFTYRSKLQGGNVQLTSEEYYQLIELACKSKVVDIIDIELSSSNNSELVSLVHHHQLITMISNHDFHKTPSLETINKQFEKMDQLNGDILKIAVMPQSKKDLLTLLEATDKAVNKFNKPIVTMSMGSMGVITRVVGEVFGCAISFAMIGKASAPGQIDVKELKKVLKVINASS